MKLDLAIRELHRSELMLARRLLEVSERHRAEHEVHHVAADLAGWSCEHVRALAEAGHRYSLSLDDSLDGAFDAGVLSERGGDVGLQLLGDLRRLHLAAVGVSLDWELLAQGAQALRDAGLLGLAQRCHPRTLRQMKWTNAMLKTLSPQIMAS
ncbi:MAG TPA: hypothetical protein VHC18_07505 [Amycolatopsis sp.]|nr:hypothetical protein [Amycolatopsis sp.]